MIMSKTTRMAPISPSLPAAASSPSTFAARVAYYEVRKVCIALWKANVPRPPV